MKDPIKAQWMADLTSGEFQQGTGALCYKSVDDGEMRYCCLGVLVMQAIRSGEVPEVRLDPETGTVEVLEVNWPYNPEGRWVSENGTLPKPVQEWAGINTPNPMLHGVQATTRNDLRGDSFEDIANAIGLEREL